MYSRVTSLLCTTPSVNNRCVNTPRLPRRGHERSSGTTRYAFVSSSPGNDEARFPEPLDPVDDLPPVTVITHVLPAGDGKLLVRGTTSDNGTVARVDVNGQSARPLANNFSQWEITLQKVSHGELNVTAFAKDEAGNVEPRAHSVAVHLQTAGH